MALSMPWLKDRSVVEAFPWDDATRAFVQGAYSDLSADANLIRQSQPILNDRTLGKYWEDSMYDYNVYVPSKKTDDWVTPYSSSISRDQANAFIATLITGYRPSEIVAQNREQVVDTTLSRVLKIVRDWTFEVDGRPGKTGLAKWTSYIEKMVVEGTVHIQEDVVDGNCVSELIPNNEIFIPNHWEPDIQKQAHVIRCINNVTYEEARLRYGDLPNFDYVKSGTYSNWSYADTDFFRDYQNGISVDDGRVQIVMTWYPVPGKKKKKYFNIIINGIPMFSWDNLMPYSHGAYPIVCEVFERFDPLYYWGNSVPNKIHQDKGYLDGMKTLVRAKGKLNLLPPLAAQAGLNVDADIIVPAKITEINGNIENLRKIPGVAEPISNADVALMAAATDEITRGTLSPVAAGRPKEGNPVTAREIILQNSNAQRLLGIFGLRLYLLDSALTYLRIHNIIQFFPKRKIGELAFARYAIAGIPLRTGAKGTLELLFKKLPDMDDDEELAASNELLQEEKKSSGFGKQKEIVHIDPDYLNELDFYVLVRRPDNSDLDTVKDFDAYDRLVRNPLILQNPSAMVEVTRMLIRALGKDEDKLLPPDIEKTPMPQLQQGGQNEQVDRPEAFSPGGGDEQSIMTNTGKIGQLSTAPRPFSII